MQPVTISRDCGGDAEKVGARNPGTRPPIDARPQQEGAPVRKPQAE
jgi:hypothetical protein